MPDHSLLADLVVTYAVALLLVVLLARLRVPSIVALMAAGVVAGPSGVRIISTPEEVEMLAEIGIVLLLFTVGLDFSLAALHTARAYGDEASRPLGVEIAAQDFVDACGHVAAQVAHVEIRAPCKQLCPTPQRRRAHAGTGLKRVDADR